LGSTRAELQHFVVEADVGSRHAMARIEQQMAEPAHPATARAHKIDDALRSCGGQQFVDLCCVQWRHATCNFTALPGHASPAVGSGFDSTAGRKGIRTPFPTMRS